MYFSPVVTNDTSVPPLAAVLELYVVSVGVVNMYEVPPAEIAYLVPAVSVS